MTALLPRHLYRRGAAEQDLHGDYRAEADGEPQYRPGPGSLAPRSHPEQRGDVERQDQRYQAQDTNTYVEYRSMVKVYTIGSGLLENRSHRMYANTPVGLQLNRGGGVWE